MNYFSVFLNWYILERISVFHDRAFTKADLQDIVAHEQWRGDQMELSITALPFPQCTASPFLPDTPFFTHSCILTSRVTHTPPVCSPVHDEEPQQTAGLCGSTRRRGGYQDPPLLQGDWLAAAGAEEDQAPLQTTHCEPFVQSEHSWLVHYYGMIPAVLPVHWPELDKAIG